MSTSIFTYIQQQHTKAICFEVKAEIIKFVYPLRGCGNLRELVMYTPTFSEVKLFSIFKYSLNHGQRPGCQPCAQAGIQFLCYNFHNFCVFSLCWDQSDLYPLYKVFIIIIIITRHEYITLCKRQIRCIVFRNNAEFEVTEYLFDDENIKNNRE